MTLPAWGAECAASSAFCEHRDRGNAQDLREALGRLKSTCHMGETQSYLCTEWIKGRGGPKSLEVLTLYTERSWNMFKK